MHNHSLRLIDDKHVLIFIQHRQRNILRLDLLEYIRNIVELYTIPFTHLVAFLCNFSVD